MRFQVVAKASAAREFNGLPENVRIRFQEALDALEINPKQKRPGLDVCSLEGRPGEWRLRIGHYRGIYLVEGDVVRFVRFGHRSVVYR